MTDHFTCPSCGWPQGPTHATVWPSELAKQFGPAPFTAPLAASKVKEEEDYLRQTNAILESIGAGSIPFTPLAAPQGATSIWPYVREDTDAKEGEEDVRNGSDDSTACCHSSSDGGGRDGSVLAEVTPDIAGLVERLRRPYVDEPDIREAADALERLMDARENNAWYQTALGSLRAELTAAKAEIEEIRQLYVDANEAVIDTKAEIEASTKRYWADQEAIVKLEAENERLRAALEEIAGLQDLNTNSHARRIARAAFFADPDCSVAPACGQAIPHPTPVLPLLGRGDDPEDDYADRVEWKSRRGE